MVHHPDGPVYADGHVFRPSALCFAPDVSVGVPSFQPRVRQRSIRRYNNRCKRMRPAMFVHVQLSAIKICSSWLILFCLRINRYLSWKLISFVGEDKNARPTRRTSGNTLTIHSGRKMTKSWQVLIQVLRKWPVPKSTLQLENIDKLKTENKR